MIHGTAIIERAKDLIRTKGVWSILGLKTLQRGTLRDVPQPENLDEWLPAILIDDPRLLYQEPAAESPIIVVPHQFYELSLYYVRRYPENEITKEEDERGLNEIVKIFGDLTWQDRMTILDNTIMVGALMREVDKRPSEFDERELELSDISVAAIRAQIEVITLG